MVIEVRPKIDVGAVITGVTITIPEYVTAIVDNVQSGVVEVSSLKARSQTAVELIASGTTLASAVETLSSAVDIDKFERKTVLGWTNFDGTLKIYVAPVAGQFNPYPYYSTSISSGTTFSASFTENAAQAKVGITPSATGTCGVWLITQA